MKANNTRSQFQPTQCPECGEQGFRVIESRFVEDTKRRRKACEKCGHRMTTYEVSQKFYKTANHNAQIVGKLRVALGTDASVGKRQKSATCDSCQYMTKGECLFGFPEAGGEFASECSTYILVR